MAEPRSTLSVAAIAELEAQLHRLLQMMEEANAGMCSTLKTLASATRSSAPSSSPTSPASSTPTAALAVATPPSTPARTAAPTPTNTTSTTLATTPSSSTRLVSSTTVRPATPVTPTAIPTPAAPSTEEAISNIWSTGCSMRVYRSNDAAVPRVLPDWCSMLHRSHNTSTLAAAPAVPTPTPTTIVAATTTASPPTPAKTSSTTGVKSHFNIVQAVVVSWTSALLLEDVITKPVKPSSASAIAAANKCVSARLGAPLVFDEMPNRYTTIVYPTHSNGMSMFGISTNVPEVLEVIEKVPGQTSEVLWLPSFTTCCTSLLGCSTSSCVFDRGKSNKGEFIFTIILPFTLLQAVISNFVLGIHSLTLQIELKPWPNWHGHQGSLIVALVCPHSSIVIWVQFSCSVHKLLVWPLHCDSWWECCADCLQLLASAGQVDSIKMEAIGLIQLHIAIPVTELYCLLFTCYHQPVQWKPPWISLVYIISNIPYIAYSLRIRTPTVPHLFWWPVVAELKFCDGQYKKFLGEVMGQCLYFRFGVPQAISLFSYNHSHIVLFYIEGRHHTHVIPRIISQVSNMSGTARKAVSWELGSLKAFEMNISDAMTYVLLLRHKQRCYRQFWKPPWSSPLCRAISWTFHARVLNLQSSRTVAMFMGLAGAKLMTGYELAMELSLFQHMLIFYDRWLVCDVCEIQKKHWFRIDSIIPARVKSVLQWPTPALDIIKKDVYSFALHILRGPLCPEERAVLKFANHLCDSSRISVMLLFHEITSVAWVAGDMQLSQGIYTVVTLYIFGKWTVTSDFDGKVILLCVSKVRRLPGVNQIDAKLILHWAEYTKNHIFLFGSQHSSLVTSYWSTKSRFQITLCMEYFCYSSLGLCHIHITDQQEAGDKDCSCTQSALSHHIVIKRVEYTSVSSRIFTCISKTVNCLRSVRFHFYNLMIEDP